MNYKKVKVYSDGSHFIAIPKDTNIKYRKKNTIQKIDNNKEEFEKAYKENKDKKRSQKTENILENIKKNFKSEDIAREYVKINLERKKRNYIYRRIRLWRKVNLQEWQYFATFTYDDKKHTEESFRKSLSNCLRHLSYRKGWKYIGVWEKSPQKKRLHFHCLLYVPGKAMIGDIIEKKDYDLNNHKIRITHQNTFFNYKYGRTDFETIFREEITNSVMYLTKYIEKTNEKIIYSKHLPQYFISDIFEDEVICTFGINNRKLILYDKFTCIDDGEIIGKASPQVISLMPKSN